MVGGEDGLHGDIVGFGQAIITLMRGKAVLLAGLLAFSFVRAESLPDFREFMKGDVWKHYFWVVPVDDVRTVVGNDAQNGYNAVIRIGKPIRGYCWANSLRIFTTVKSGGLEVEKEYPYDMGVFRISIGADADFYYYGYCKDGNGNIVVEYRKNLVVHPPSPVREVLLYWTDRKRADKVSTFEDLLREYRGKPVVAGGDVYEVRDLDPVQSLAICRKQGGELYMVRGGQTIPFAEYLWNVHSTGEFRIYRKTSPWFNPAEAGMVSAMNAREHARVFSGLYVCKGGRQEWTYSYTPEAGQAGLFHRGSIRAGIDERAIARAQDYAGQNVPSQDAMTSLALQTAKLRAPVKVQQGTLIYETSYNGQEGACSLVSVSQIVSGRVQAVHNYRVCGDRVEYVGESGLPALPQGIVQVKQDIARMCQKFGQAELLYEGTTIKCRALRDKDKCLVELTYLQGGKLVGKEEVDGCK